MNLFKTVSKSVLGFLTFVIATVATDPSIIVNMVPANIANMTIGGAIAAVIVGVTNYLKNKNKAK